MARPKFQVGDLVRFKETGKVDWEVVATEPPALGQYQRLLLRSGMSDRLTRTTAEHVVPREMKMDKEALAAWQQSQRTHQ